MYQFVYIVSATVKFLIIALELLMMCRAIISWFPIDDDSPIVGFLYAVTEPVIIPVRSVFEYFGWFEGFPLDMAFFVTFIILSIIRMFL